MLCLYLELWFNLSQFAWNSKAMPAPGCVFRVAGCGFRKREWRTSEWPVWVHYSICNSVLRSVGHSFFLICDKPINRLADWPSWFRPLSHSPTLPLSPTSQPALCELLCVTLWLNHGMICERFCDSGIHPKPLEKIHFFQCQYTRGFLVSLITPRTARRKYHGACTGLLIFRPLRGDFAIQNPSIYQKFVSRTKAAGRRGIQNP